MTSDIIKPTYIDPDDWPGMQFKADGTLVNEFDRDLGREMVELGSGHDPRNHIGDRVIMAVLGVDHIPSIRIGRPKFTESIEPDVYKWDNDLMSGVIIDKPKFTRAAAMTADILSAELERSKEVPT